jgi:pimeloyl-ACP methyl ester carboxylesterase
MSITSSPEGGLRAAAGARDPVEFHDVAGARLAVARLGCGPPVVCLHATGHGARDYEAFADRVGDAFEVVAVDWPGQGRSPREATPASAPRYAALLTALLEKLGGDPAIVVGCSIGGAAAIETAAKRPDLVRALVVCNAGGLAAIDAPSRFAIGLMHRFFAAGALGARWYPKAFEIYYRMVLPGPAARAQRDRIVAAAAETAPVLAEAWASFASPQADLRSLAPTLRCPTLFAWTAKDRILPWSKSRAAATTVPDHRVEMFDGGHAAFLEDPDRFAERFRRFAAGLAAKG